MSSAALPLSDMDAGGLAKVALRGFSGLCAHVVRQIGKALDYGHHLRASRQLLITKAVEAQWSRSAAGALAWLEKSAPHGPPRSAPATPSREADLSDKLDLFAALSEWNTPDLGVDIVPAWRRAQWKRWHAQARGESLAPAR